jgi:hypothetical protein
MEVLGISGKIFNSLGLVDLANCLCKIVVKSNLKQLYSVLHQLKDPDSLGNQQRTILCRAENYVPNKKVCPFWRIIE